MSTSLMPGVCAAIAFAVQPISAANAEIYKCDENGKTVFQGNPCKGAGAAIKVQPANGSIDASAAPKASSDGISAATRLKDNVKAMRENPCRRTICSTISS